MVSFKEAVKPVEPIAPGENQKRSFEHALAQYKSRRFPKAALTFLALSRVFGTHRSSKDDANANAMMSNYSKMLAARVGESSDKVEGLLKEALAHLDLALEYEPYWADFLFGKGKLDVFIHWTYGCEIPFDKGVWTASCYRVSKALGLPGVSPGMTERLECSICGKDPVVCEHVPGRIYDGYVALMVAKDIQFDHVSVVDEPMQKETYILPRPLTPDLLKKILPTKFAEDVISGKKQLRCIHLLKAIFRHGLRGIEWKKP